MRLIDKIIAIFLDKSSVSQKAAIIVIAIALMIFADHLFDFSYNYRTSNRINNLEKINRVINNPITDSITKSAAVGVRNEIISHQNVFSFSYSITKSLYNSAIYEYRNNGKSLLWSIVSSCGIYLFFILAIPLLVILIKH